MGAFLLGKCINCKRVNTIINVDILIRKDFKAQYSRFLSWDKEKMKKGRQCMCNPVAFFFTSRLFLGEALF